MELLFWVEVLCVIDEVVVVTGLDFVVTGSAEFGVLD